jgi:hypothetical protein
MQKRKGGGAGKNCCRKISAVKEYGLHIETSKIFLIGLCTSLT